MPGVIGAFLWAQPYALPVFGGLAVVFAVLGWLLGRAGRARWWAVFLLGVSGALVVATSLTPARAGTGSFGMCRVAVPSVDATLSTAGVLGLALFVPIGLAAVLVFRRFWITLALGVTGVAALGLTHALVPALGRACDSDLLLANLLGVLVGAVLGGVATGFRRDTEVRFRRTPWVVAAAGLVAVATLTAVLVRPAVDEPLPEQASASREQEDLLRETARRFLGPDGGHQLREVRRADGQTLLIAALTTGTANRGIVHLDWPSGEVTAAEFTPPLTPAAALVDATAAKDIAIRRAQSYFPWVLGAELRVTPVAGGDFSASWRQRKDGVLLPLRADLLLDRNGGLVQFSTARTPTPDLCPVTVDQPRAEAAATAARPGRQVARGELVARRVGERWTPLWALGLVPAGAGPEQVFVDACGGQVVPESELR
ncbi:hypothetical protein [Crossiella cryophila]|uniref:MFS family permease n=1 Tax=Crossiella cryophila TaxID=43355 RepID=A0A7W7CG59_9PSEU|nr:hypothetical protein [Crossiella cryophila]MBB4680621.1 MFS family permease [Crossiella cryophila]